MLLVAPGEDAATAELRKFLAQHGMAVAFCAAKTVCAGRAAGFDLVLISGPGRRAGKITVDLGRPVLALGSYGCMAFKSLHLKNAHPYT